MEGVMMRGEKSVATAVRTPDGRIEVETSRIQEEQKWWKKVPVLRGFLNFFYMMAIGSKVLMRSAEVYGEDVQGPLALHREHGPNARIVNCRDYVSLRAKRSTGSARLAKVPLGAMVMAFPEFGGENGFTLCEYQGKTGYILTEYLELSE